MTVEKNFAAWPGEHRRYPAPDALTGADLPEHGVLSVATGTEETDFLLRHRPGADALVVVFGGALGGTTRREARPPFFSGLGVTAGLNASLLAVSDPTLHLAPDIRIGWYAGSRHLDVMALCRHVVRRVAEGTGAPRILFLGGSAGGHAALNIALDFPGSLALVLNPQTDVGRYYAGHTGRYARTAFGLDTYAAIPPAVVEARRLDLLPHHDRPLRHRVVFLQNRTDPHLRRHALPLLRVVGRHHPPRAEGRLLDFDGRLLFAAGNWGSGHVAPPRGIVRALLKRLIDPATAPDGALRRCAAHLNGADAPIDDATDLRAPLLQDIAAHRPAADPPRGTPHPPAATYPNPATLPPCAAPSPSP